MATIQRLETVADGLDVRCLLSDGTVTTFHFQTAPGNVQAACDTAENSYLAGQSTLSVTAENGTVITQ